MILPSAPVPPAEVRVGILVLDYHHPRETLDCVRNLLAREPLTTRILWIENDAARTWPDTRALLEATGLAYQVLDVASPSFPPEGVVGVLLNQENLGYAGGNNVGLRFLHRLATPFAWILNNDTLVLYGNSEDLVRAAEERPDVGAWGTAIVTDHVPCYFGGIVSLRDFSIQLAHSPGCLEAQPASYVSGCSLFLRPSVAAEVGFIPDHYFLYYEDSAFGLALRKAGYALSGIWGVVVFHIESLSTGRRSRLMEFYNRRNRWHFIREHFPDHLPRQKRRLWYHLQKHLFRGQFKRTLQEFLAYRDFKAGFLGQTHRDYPRQKRT